MHEFGVMMSILEAAESKAHELDAGRILAINLVIGDRASIIDDSLLYYFEELTPGTIAEGAQLNVRRVPSQFYCQDCDQNFVVKGHNFCCPECGSIGQITDIGSEFLIDSIEIK